MRGVEFLQSIFNLKRRPVSIKAYKSIEKMGSVVDGLIAKMRDYKKQKKIITGFDAFENE